MGAIHSMPGSKLTLSLLLCHGVCHWLQAFDELLLLKRGGRTIYNGPTGRDSCTLVEYFQSIQNVPRVSEGINPATWMLEISTVAAEERLGLDFADVFASSEANA